MKQLVYIISPEFSGSTVTSTLLSSIPNYVSVGETTNTFNRNNSDTLDGRPCSCGHLGEECILWSKILKTTKNLDKLKSIERYEILDNELEKIYGDKYSLIDISKRIDTLLLLNSRYKRKIKVIFLTRDLRSYLHGRLEKPSKLGLQRFGTLLNLLPLWFGETINWLYRTGRIYICLRYYKIENLRIGFEEISKHSEIASKIIIKYLQQDNMKIDFSLKVSEHHILNGNRIFIDDKISSGFKYNDKWRMRKWPFLCLVTLKILSKINKKFVYSNTR